MLPITVESYVVGFMIYKGALSTIERRRLFQKVPDTFDWIKILRRQHSLCALGQRPKLYNTNKQSQLRMLQCLPKPIIPRRRHLFTWPLLLSCTDYIRFSKIYRCNYRKYCTQIGPMYTWIICLLSYQSATRVKSRCVLLYSRVISSLHMALFRSFCYAEVALPEPLEEPHQHAASSQLPKGIFSEETCTLQLPGQVV